MRCSESGMTVVSVLKENAPNAASARNGGCFEIRVSIASIAGQFDFDPIYRRDNKDALAHAERLVAEKILELRLAGKWTGLAKLAESDDDTD